MAHVEKRQINEWNAARLKAVRTARSACGGRPVWSGQGMG